MTQKITQYYLCMYLQLTFRRKNTFSERITSFKGFSQSTPKNQSGIKAYKQEDIQQQLHNSLPDFFALAQRSSVYEHTLFGTL